MLTLIAVGTTLVVMSACAHKEAPMPATTTTSSHYSK